MKQLSKGTFTRVGQQLESVRQASRQQQAFSLQAPVGRIRRLCSRPLLPLKGNEKVAMLSDKEPTHPTHTCTHTLEQRLANTHACIMRTNYDTCAYLHKHMQTQYRDTNHIHNNINKQAVNKSKIY